MSFPKIFWDLDGTLIESNVQHAKAWFDAFEAHDYMVPYEKIRRLIGVGGSLLVKRALNQDIPADVNDALNKTHEEIFVTKYLDEIEAFPGVDGCLKRLKERGAWQAIMTGSDEDVRDRLLEKAGLQGVFDAVYSSSEVENPKPSGDILLKALREEDISPEHAVLIGDTIYDEQVAVEAGVSFLAVLCGGGEVTDFSSADRLFTSPVDAANYLLDQDQLVH